MNFVMIMGFLGLFSLSLTAAPKTTAIHKTKMLPKGYEKQPSLQEQIFQLNMSLADIRRSQLEIADDLIKQNCELGRLEVKIDNKEPVFIETPEGLYIRQDGKLILIKPAEKHKSVTDVIADKPSDESVQNEKLKIEMAETEKEPAQEPDQPETNEIFPEMAKTPEEHMQKAAEAKAQTEIAQDKVAEGVKKGADEAKKAEEPKLDNHKPKPDENLKKQASNEINDNRYINELAQDYGYQL